VGSGLAEKTGAVSCAQSRRHPADSSRIRVSPFQAFGRKHRARCTRDLKLAQELLGHSRISTISDIYVHLDDTMAGEATEALAAAIAPTMVVPGSDKIQ